MSTPVHSRPINERIDWLMELSRNHSAGFCSPENHLARQRYLAEHNTLIIAMKCMDGRIHLPHVTRTPLGIIQPFRNLGGIFDLGWPYLGDLLADTVQNAVSAGRRVLIIITYHYSRGATERGCAGFNCDRDAAMAHAFGIRRQVETLFGRGHQTVYPLVCGFETDEDALVLHGPNDQYLDLSTIPLSATDETDSKIAALYPDMPGAVQRDLLPLVRGNIQHIAEIRKSDRELNIEHREWVICVGRGFDFLHAPNLALIVGPYSPDLAHPIRQAAGIIRANMESGRIPDDGFLLLSSAPYKEPGTQKARATLKSAFLLEFAANVIEQDFPELAERMVTRSAILNWPERRLEVQSAKPKPEHGNRVS
ncbi:carboxysome shell carbonic anhydrase [Marinobacter sp. TBZ242]|uniref:Carboxysome shell carbonic anhydrase n=1 Tax=Marinobacter azerbaijanicus TaxID=3050455 RepID=A0ABT7I9M2_9GAMM|nr:carboxysome shell carbonic anhydrase domain-containg protein [Marinobacter sp. TBZ242]MDL0430408.1 carboxysome shell carbonic anhydrase [Marinobacter sp. TBZ242]